MSSKGNIGYHFQIDQNNCFRLQKLKLLCREYIFLVILTMKKLLKCFMKKNNKKQIQIKKSLKLKKDKEIGDKLYAKWKVCGNSFNS